VRKLLTHCSNPFQYKAASSIFSQDFERQKGNVFFMVALNAEDQLRQRMAWALSQILVVNQVRHALYHLMFARVMYEFSDPSPVWQ
jgi:uncharacterized protein (DUF1800 family)